MGTSLDNPIERTGFKVTALVLSKLRRRDINAEYQRLTGLTRAQAWLQVGAVMAGLFLLAWMNVAASSPRRSVRYSPCLRFSMVPFR